MRTRSVSNDVVFHLGFHRTYARRLFVAGVRRLESSQTIDDDDGRSVYPNFLFDSSHRKPRVT